MAGGWWPKQRHDLPLARVAGFPTPGMRFDDLVDHLCRQLLGKTRRRGWCRPLPRPPRPGSARRSRLDHPIVRWKMPQLLTTLLDTPDHMHR